MLSLLVIVCFIVNFRVAAGVVQHGSIVRYCVNETALKTAQGRIAIAIAGFARGIHFTLPSIERHVFGPLRKSNIEFDVFMSTASAPNFHDHETDDFETAQFHPCLFAMHSQEYMREKTFGRFCSLRNLSCGNGPLSDTLHLAVGEHPQLEAGNATSVLKFKNELVYLETHQQVAQIIRSQTVAPKKEYDAVLLIRPDVAFIRDIDLPALLPLIKGNTRQIWIPDFQPFGGLNDRAAFGSQSVMLRYLERGDSFMANSTFELDAAESFLSTYLTGESIEPQKSSMRFMRVFPIEENGSFKGAVMGSEFKPDALNMNADDIDLNRCVGSELFHHGKQHAEYKLLNVDQC